MAKSSIAEAASVKLSVRHIRRRAKSYVPVLTKVLPISLSLLLLLGAVDFVLSRSDWAAVVSSLAKLSWLSIIAAFVLMLGGGMLASLRLKMIAADLGYRLSFRDAVAALSLSQLAGLLFFQIAGQLIARGVLFSRRRIPVSGTIVVTGYERLAALAVAFSLAIVGAIFLFGKISVNTAEGGIHIIKIFLGLFVVGIFGAAFCWGSLLLENLPRLNSRNFLKLGRSIALSLAIQFTTMGAYIVLSKAIAPTIPFLSLAAATTLVMFAASLPISFAGWGIREMSAIIALGAIGVAADASFAVAALVGLTSLAVLGLMAISTIHHHHQPAPVHPREENIRLDFATILDYGLAIIATTAVFFQIFVPVNKGAINVNLADPVVILGGALFILQQVKGGWSGWRIPNLQIYVALATLLIGAAFLHGLAEFGWTNWAFTNRLLGWFILLAYAATGALIVTKAGRNGLDLLLRTFVVTAAAIIVLEVALLILGEFGVQSAIALIQLPFTGFSINKNALGFQLLLAACACLVARWKNPAVPLGIIFVGIWFSASRATYLALPIVFAIAAYIRCLSLRSTILASIIALGIIGLVAVIPDVIAYFPKVAGFFTPGGNATQFPIYVVILEPITSDIERLKSLAEGWTMFSAHPIFGAGLGAFMNQEIQTGTPLVIHSTPLWLLAETGIVGLLVMAVPVCLIFWSEIRSGRNVDIAGKLLILIITAFGVVSNVHEIMYQRAFWILFGAALCLPRYSARKKI